MNSKFKKLIIIMIVVLVLGLGGLFTYMAMSSVSNTTVHSLMIIDENSKIMKDQHVYIGDLGSSEFKINISISSSTQGDNGGVSLYSTNPYVANIVWKNNSYVVECYNSGVAQIVAQSKAIANLKDYINVHVYENYAIDLKFKDAIDEDKKTIDVFADDVTYGYQFDLVGLSEDQGQNSRLFRVVEDSINKNVIKSAKINSQNNTLEVCAHRYYNGNPQNNIVQNSNEYIVLQSGINDSSGNFIVKNNYIVKINIKCNEIEDMQLVISNNDSFNNDMNYIFSMLYDEERVQSTIKYSQNEKLMRKVFLNDDVRSIYFKVRLVMSNGDVYYVTEENKTGISYDSNVSINRNNKSGEDCFAVFTLDSEVDPRVKFKITLYPEHSPSREIVSKEFIFILLTDESKIGQNPDTDILGAVEASMLDVDELYVLKDGVYTYSYYDARFKRVDTITDLEGNVIGFTGDIRGIKYNIYDYDSESNEYDGYITYYEQQIPNEEKP